MIACPKNYMTIGKDLKFRNETKQSTAKKTPRASGVFFVCGIIIQMELIYKLINYITLLATTIFGVAYLNFTLDDYFYVSIHNLGNFQYTYISFLLSIFCGLFIVFFWARIFKTENKSHFWIFGLTGIFMGLMISSFVFIGVPRKNIKCGAEDKNCIFNIK